MLSKLFGSKNAERILLFLLVNESCCTAEIQQAFSVSLASLQNIMQKLEKAGIIFFERQGKKKLCQLNPSYPLYQELKHLLKAAFVHLPAVEKKVLFSRQAHWSSSQNSFAHKKKVSSCLQSFWNRLEKIETVSIQTQSGGQAFGKVSIVKEREGVLLFTESGSWVSQGSGEMDFSKTLRWSIDYAAGLVSLEHLHYGKTRPVFLFHLTPMGSDCLQSVDSYLCLQDCYFGRILLDAERIQFIWRILGPRKNEVLYHVYN